MMRRVAAALCGWWLVLAGWAAPRPLYDYYQTKYPIEQVQLYQEAADRMFAEASPAHRQQAAEEALAQSYVVLHRTRWHDLANNVAVTTHWRSAIEKACHDFNVPVTMAEGILTWENSGSTQAMSGAACAGLGQMSDGAVRVSHRYALQRSVPASLLCRVARVGAAALDMLGLHSSAMAHSVRQAAAAWRATAQTWGTVARHRRLMARAKVHDERMLAACNIEDSVIFMRVLLDAYDNRVDLAIEAYHNGLRNDDDLLHDYLQRVDPAMAAAPLQVSLQTRHIDYLTLWNDERCREMLNGLRTMDGFVTTVANRQEALGDESDIYIWKVCAAYAALLAPPGELERLAARYQGTQEQAETRGFQPSPPWTTVRFHGPALRLMPEMAGYLEALAQRLGPQAVLGVSASARGIAVEVGSTDPAALHALLYRDWLFDRIYLSRVDGSHWHICLNPRFGRDYLAPARTANR